MSTPGFPLLDIAIPIIEELPEAVDDEKREEYKSLFLSVINKEKSYEEARKELADYSSLTTALDKIHIIMKTEQDEIPAYSAQDQHNMNTSHSEKSSKERKKTRPWADAEDNRLLMGVFLYGLDNWNSISNYVGNGRLRSQCMQRWTRGLDPRISKKQWSKEEEELLLKLVEEYKDRSWTRIASHFGNRSDVQCRYKYIQLQRMNRVEQSVSSPPSAASPIHNEVKSPVAITSFADSKKKGESLVRFASPVDFQAPDSPSSADEFSNSDFTKGDIPTPAIMTDHIDFNVDTSESPQLYEDNILLTDFQISLGEISSLYTSRALFDSSVW